jgi:uncharacterized membrane-anchored protein YjiN (DUF445 family)
MTSGLPTPAPGGVCPVPLTPIGGEGDEIEKEDRLNSMKRKASLMLVACALVFLVSRLLESRWPWLAYVRATAEAAIVGGLADWFAVTALFRHPMGIPIPHTAIIPARKDRIGRSLGRFVENNFLSRDVIAQRVAGLRMAEKVARWLTKPENTRRIARHVGSSLVAAAHVLRDEEVMELIERPIAERVRAIKVAPLLGKILAILTADRRHQEILDEALRLAARAAEDNEEAIRQRVTEESPWWVPELVDQKIHRKIVSGIEHTLAEVAADSAHPLRARFDEAIENFIIDLRRSPATIARAEAIKEEVLSHPALREFAGSLWADAKAALVSRVDRPETAEPDAVQRGLQALAQAVLDDPALLEKVDRWMVEGLVFAVDQYRHEVAQLIEDTVGKWDPDATSRKIELQIGRDLQFIRINGTVVGGLVGLAIAVLTRLAV